MNLQDFSELGQQIERTVKNAVDSMNYNQLNKNINKMFSDAFDTDKDARFHYQPKNPYNEQTDYSSYQKTTYQHKAESTKTKSNKYVNYQHKTESMKFQKEQGNRQPHYTGSSFPVISNPPGSVSSILMMIFGYIGIGIITALLLIIFSLSTIVGMFFKLGTAFLILLLPLLALSVFLATKGTLTHRRIKRFRQYVSVLGTRTFCSFTELSKSVGKNNHFIYKDVNRLILAGFFPQGHIDEQRTCLIVTDSTYEQYLLAQQSMQERLKHAQATKAAANQQKMTEDENEAFEKIISKGKVYMLHIREANDAIPDTEISNKLYRMELIVQKIFDYVRIHPEQISQLRRFIDYYMPTTDKLVTAYKDFDTQPIQGENIKNAKLEIAKALDTINDAYEKLYDSMYADAAMDVASDISVLQTLLAQEGLTKDDFKQGRKPL